MHMTLAQEFRSFASAFATENVRYLVIGGMAVVAHGYVRSTVDIDIVLDFGNGNEMTALTALKQLGFKPRIPEPIESFASPSKREDWRKNRNMEAFCVQKDHCDLDILTAHPFSFCEAYAKAMWKDIGTVAPIMVPFVDLRTLIAMKSQVGRLQDQADIEQLIHMHQSPQPKPEKP